MISTFSIPSAITSLADERDELFAWATKWKCKCRRLTRSRSRWIFGSAKAAGMVLCSCRAGALIDGEQQIAGSRQRNRISCRGAADLLASKDPFPLHIRVAEGGGRGVANLMFANGDRATELKKNCVAFRPCASHQSVGHSVDKKLGAVAQTPLP